MFLAVVLVIPLLIASCTGLCPHGFYGESCTNTCSENCVPLEGYQLCLNSTGECIEGCRVGYHGFQCNRTCPEFCLQNICTIHSGICTHGCRDNYCGDWCTKCEPEDNGGYIRIHLVSVVIICTVFSIILAIQAICLFRRQGHWIKLCKRYRVPDEQKEITDFNDLSVKVMSEEKDTFYEAWMKQQ